MKAQEFKSGKKGQNVRLSEKKTTWTSTVFPSLLIRSLAMVQTSGRIGFLIGSEETMDK